VRLPPGARSLSPTEARVLAAIVAGARTVRGAADAAGVPATTAHEALVRLRVLGLVAWEDGTQGTLRTLVAFVPR